MNGDRSTNGLRLPGHASVKRKRLALPRANPGEQFLLGPIPWHWLEVAGQHRGRGLHVAIALWHLATMERNAQVSLPLAMLRGLGVGRHAARRGLKALERAGVVSVVRGRGKAAVGTSVSAPEAVPDDD